MYRRPQSRWVQPQRELSKKLPESSWIHTWGLPWGHVNHRACLCDHWGCVGSFVPRAHRKILLAAEATHCAQGAGTCQTVALPLGQFWVTAESGINRVCREQTRAPYSLTNTSKVCKFPSTNDSHANGFGWWMRLTVVYLERSEVSDEIINKMV